MSEHGDENQSPAAARIQSPSDVARLADEILDPQRRQAIVCATSPTWSAEPLVDVAALSAAVRNAARVYVLPTGDLSWELTERLPPRLDVYGGAVRVWWPGVGFDADPFAHPLFLIHDRSASRAAISRIVEEFQQRGLLAEVSAERPEIGTEAAAVVTAVRSWGVELTIAGGEPAFAHPRELTRSDWLEPERVVRPGQPVRVSILDRASTRQRVAVSLLPFEPDPWQRLSEQYGEGSLVEGIVVEFRNFGAFVEIYPGLSGLLHRSQISREWVSHPEDFLELGQRLVVRVVRIDEAASKIDLSLLDILPESHPEPPASIYPDGPPWLPRVAEPAGEEDADAVDGGMQAAGGESVLDHIFEERVADEPLLDVTLDSPESVAEPSPVEEEQAQAAEEDLTSTVPIAGEDGAVELEALERTVEDALELQRRIGGLFEGAEQRIRQLRAEAAQIRQLLQRDLAEARLRLLEFAESETAALAGSTEAVLAEARAEAEELRERLLAAEADRRQLLDRLRTERERAEDAERRAVRLRGELRAEREAGRSRERELAALDPGGGRRFLDEVRSAWERLTVDDDRRRFPWREPVLGPEFLPSLMAVQGVSRDRVVEVSAHAASGRAAEIPGLELHPLRSSEGGGTPQRERDDGAKAWRCSLQASTPAARRLHYWTLPGGGVELAKIVYHDDFSIS